MMDEGFLLLFAQRSRSTVNNVFSHYGPRK